MFDVDESEGLSVTAPPGVNAAGICAAVVDGDGLHPIPPDWTVFFEEATSDPAQLVGKLAVVRWSGGGSRPVVRTIRRGSGQGLFSLQALSGSMTEDVEILAAHKVVSISAPK